MASLPDLAGMTCLSLFLKQKVLYIIPLQISRFLFNRSKFHPVKNTWAVSRFSIFTNATMSFWLNVFL